MVWLRYIYRLAMGSVRGFIRDECFYKASALTFYTLLSIVPILAIAFGIAKGVGLKQYLEKEVSSWLIGQPEVSRQIIKITNTLLKNTHGGLVTVFGLIGLLWTSIQLFSNIELSLNVIWKVKTRSFLRQLRDYPAMLIISAILFIGSSILSLTLLKFTYGVSLYGVFPFLVNWLLFSCIYYFLPNTQVQCRYAFMAGIIAGTIYQIFQWIYIHFQIGVASYGAIYGSFAALPLFLIWVNTSWAIVLVGAEIAYMMEVMPNQYHSQKATKKQIGLWLTSRCAEEFLKGNPPLQFKKIEQEIGLPMATIKKITQVLCEEGILEEVQLNYVLIAKNPADIKMKEVLDAFDKDEEKFAITMPSQILQLDAAVQKLENHVAASTYNRSLKDISLTVSKQLGFNLF